MEPLISVIVPIYNVEPYLRKCVDSILNQTYQNLEVILVDDGSPDNCGAICDEYAEKDERVRVIHKENGGLSSVRNLALGSAHGDYVTFVDGDDWINEQLYQTVISYEPFDVALFGITYVDSRTGERTVCSPCKKTMALEWKKSSEVIEYLVKSSLLGYGSNKIYRKSLLLGLKYLDVQLREDLIFNIGVYGKTQQILLVNQVGYFYYQHNDSILKKTYSGEIPDIASVAEQMTEIHPQLTKKQNRELSNYVIKQYICDAVYKFVFMNPALSERDAIEALRKIFCSKMISKTLRFYPGDGALFMLLVLCVKIKAPKLFYRVMKRKWNV